MMLGAKAWSLLFSPGAEQAEGPGLALVVLPVPYTEGLTASRPGYETHTYDLPIIVTEDGEEQCRAKLASAERQLAAMMRRDINHPPADFHSLPLRFCCGNIFDMHVQQPVCKSLRRLRGVHTRSLRVSDVDT